jgi:ABC-2 type transport system permease protein
VLVVSTMEFLLSLPVILIAMAVTRTLPGPLILLYPVGIVVQFFLMYGLGLGISSLSVMFPDLARLVRIFLRAAFYLTPVLYSINNIPQKAQFLAALNPVVGPLGLYRIGFWPSESESFFHYGISLAICLAILVVGFVVFRRLEPRILKEA